MKSTLRSWEHIHNGYYFEVRPVPNDFKHAINIFHFTGKKDDIRIPREEAERIAIVIARALNENVS